MITIKKNPKKNNLKKKLRKKKQAEIFELQNSNIKKTREILEQITQPTPIKTELELLKDKYKELGGELVIDIYESLGKCLIESEKILDTMIMEKKTQEFDQNLQKIENEKMQKTQEIFDLSEYNDKMTEEQFMELNKKINLQLDQLNGDCYSEIDKQFQTCQNSKNTTKKNPFKKFESDGNQKNLKNFKTEQDLIPTQTSKEDSQDEPLDPEEFDEILQSDQGVNKNDFLLLQQHLMKEMQENKVQEQYLDEHFPSLNEKSNKKKKKIYYSNKNSPVDTNCNNNWNVHHDRNFQSYDLENSELANLCAQFPNIDQNRIETFYLNLGNNFVKTKNFLIAQFPNEFQRQAKRPKKKFKPKTVIESSDDEYDYDYEEIPKNAQDMQIYQKSCQQLQVMYGDLRNAREQLLKNIQIYSRLSRGGYQCQYTTQKNKARTQLELYSNRSIYILFVICAKKNYQTVDLHFLTVKESIKLLEMIFMEIRRKFTGKFELEIITGKGNHSKNRQAVLFPKISSYLKSKGYKFRNHDQSRLYCAVVQIILYIQTLQIPLVILFTYSY